MAIYVGSGRTAFLSSNSADKGTGVGIGTTTTTGRNAGVNTETGTMIYNVTDNAVQVYDGNNWITGLQSIVEATGGTKSTTSRSGFAVHTFTGPGSLEVTASGDIELLVVGGGGSGSGSIPSYWAGNGGGAGGMVEVSSYPVTAGVTYPVVVGGGGAANPVPGPTLSNKGNNGTQSEFNNPPNTPQTVIALGGGAFLNKKIMDDKKN